MANINAYKKFITKSGEWGRDIDLQILTYALGVVVNVVEPQSVLGVAFRSEINPLELQSLPETSITLSGGVGHYQSAILQQQADGRRSSDQKKL